MKRAGTVSNKTTSAFEVEAGRFAFLLKRWITYELDRFFDQSVNGPGYRATRILVFVVGLAVAAFLAEALLYFGSLRGSGSEIQLTTLAFNALAIACRIALIVGIAASLAMHMAGNYLADILEIKDVRVAWKFIDRLAFGIGPEVLHLRDGKIVEEDQNSPVALIGGPGYVQVEFDMAALFEKPDGTPHVIGPTRRIASERRDHETEGLGAELDGFERLREPVISLRDQYIGSLAGESLSVVGRSLDGIPVSAVDVRGIFSVRRETNGNAAIAALQAPFRLDPADIEKLIYTQAVPVLTDGAYASGEPGGWTNIMQGLIQSSLLDFMSRNRLSDYMAGTGDNELQRAEFREDTILSKTLQLADQATEVAVPTRGSSTTFHPRTELTRKFSEDNTDFTKAAMARGLELHWIGVGTWKIPDENSSETVREKHLEAWRINRENLQRADSKALDTAAEEAMLEEKLRLIQETPIFSHQKNQAKYTERNVLIECLVQDFWEQMAKVLDLYYDSGTHPPELNTLEQAILHLEELLKIRQIGYLVGGGTMSRVHRRPAVRVDQDGPPAPSSRAEAEQYRSLLGRLDGNYKVAEGMIANEARRHPDLKREELIGRIMRRMERYGH